MPVGEMTASAPRPSPPNNDARLRPSWSDKRADQPLLEGRRIGLGSEDIVVVFGVKPPFPGPLLEPDEIARPRLRSPVRQAHGDDPVSGPGVFDRRKSFHARGKGRFARRVEPRRRVLNSRDQTHTGSSENPRHQTGSPGAPSPEVS
jgi:hypothetical protein